MRRLRAVESAARSIADTPGSRTVIDIGLVAIYLYTASVIASGATPLMIAVTVIAAGGMFFRHHWPTASTIVAIAGLMFGIPATFATFVTLITLATHPRRIWVSVAAGAATVMAYLTSVNAWSSPADLLADFLYAVLDAVAPVSLGMLLQTRTELRSRIDALGALQQQDRLRAAEIALSRERAILAREMHDVVSHQVSLIAVQAGALQLTTTDETTRSAAALIRSLSVTTLDELRTMVEVLRAAGGTNRMLIPQPTLSDLPELLDASGIDVDSNTDLLPVLPVPIQRAIYRVIQEGLTNARKHSPGATVIIRASITGSTLTLTLHAEPAVTPPLHLPSAQMGLTGMRERAEILGGTLNTRLHHDGSHDLEINLPLR